MLECAGADLDERIVGVDIEDEGVLRNYQRLAGAGDDRHLRQHLRLELAAGIFHFAAQLKRVRRGIDVRTDARDHSLEHFIGESGRHC